MPDRSRNVRTRSKKNRNINPTAESSTDSTPLDSPAVSPPTHLPTPLPELDEYTIASFAHTEEQMGLGFDVPPHRAGGPQDDQGPALATQPQLIDFDFESPHPTSMPTPERSRSRPLISDDDQSEHPAYHHPGMPITEYGDHAYDAMSNTLDPGVYRSPPFIEAQLPPEDDEEEPPLPVLPRISGERAGFSVQRDGDEEDEDEDDPRGFGGFAGGHVRSPTIPSRTLSSRSKTHSLGIGISPPIVSPTYSTSTSHSHHSRSQSQSRSHVRSPSSPTAAISTPSGALDSLSRTLRGYSPFPAPSASTAAAVSSSSRRRHEELIPTGRRDRSAEGSYEDRRKQEFEREYEREDNDDSFGYGGAGGYGYGHRARSTRSPPSATMNEGPTTTTSGLTERLRGSPSPLPLNQQRKESGQRRGDVEVEGKKTVGGRGGGGDEVDRVVWARWERLRSGEGSAKGSPLLVLGYTSGFQIWDVSNLSSVTEVLNLNLDNANQDEWGGPGERVVSVALVPQETSSVGRKSLGETVKIGEDGRGLLLGVLLETGLSSSEPDAGSKTTLAIYSLRTHRVVERLSFDGAPDRLECSDRFIVVSTASPPALHIISSSSFQLLYTIPASGLASFTTPRSPTYTSSGLQVPSYLSSAYSSASSAGSNPVPAIQEAQGGRPEDPTELPHPVFALSHRLLAYAVPSTASSGSSSHPGGLKRKDSSSSQGSGPSPSSLSSASAFTGLNLPKIPTTQAELGSAALKVGGTVFSGMKFLGGIAFEAAKNRINNSGNSNNSGGSSPTTGGAGRDSGVRGFFSRSAPSGGGGVIKPLASADSEEERKRRRFSGMSGGAAEDVRQQQKGSVSPNATRLRLERGHAIVVVDLDALLPGSAPVGDEGEARVNRPRVVVEFIGSRSQPIANLAWSEDGAEVLVVPRDGYVTKVFRVRPAAAPLKDSNSTAEPPVSPTVNTMTKAASTSSTRGSTNTPVVLGSAVQLYELRRGRTTAVVEDVKVIGDGRWTGVLTKNRTVHVFATNPMGGRPHHGSHLEGRVRNMEPVPFKMIDLPPLARLRGSRIVVNEEDGPPPPLSFTFVDASEIALPFSLSPSRTATSPTVAVDPTSSPPLSSPRHPRAPKNYQDVLMFDCATATLSLHRLTVEQKQKETGIVSAALSGTSLSLPGMGGSGPLQSVSSSLSSNSGVGKMSNAPGSKQQQKPLEEQFELVGRTNVVATWDLRKRKDWEEIRVLGTREGDLGSGTARSAGGGGPGKNGGSDEWLAHAELLTGPKFRTARTRSVYLSHQFSFHTLGEDYHGLVRQYRLDVSGTKIDVRKDVPIQAFSTGSSVPSSNAGTELFVEGFSPPHRTRGQFNVSSSFDEPLASALQGELDYQPPTAVLPMYPNGVPGASSRSFRNSIPIRKMAGLGDGVSEGLGRIRREMGRVRSPKLGPRASGDGDIHGDVLLEFDEEVEDFMAPRVVEPLVPRRGRDTGMDDDIVGKVDEEIWEGGWDNQDRQAVEEEEQFHAISTAQYVADDLGATDSTVSAHVGIPVVSPPAKGKKKPKKK